MLLGRTGKEWVNILQQPMQNKDYKEFPSGNAVQLKYDGWWCAMICDNGAWHYLTSGGAVKLSRGDIPIVQGAVLVGEWMYGTNWAQTHHPGRFYAHDFYQEGERLVHLHQYSTRYRMLAEFLRDTFQGDESVIRLMITFPSSSTKYLAQTFCEGRNRLYEGLVYKSLMHHWGETFFRYKSTITMDYIATGFVEGGGRLRGTLGAIQGSFYGQNQSVVSIGGGFTDAQRNEIWKNRERLLGKVFEAKGFQLFASGSLRHPQFCRWREDKLPEKCVYEEKEN